MAQTQYTTGNISPSLRALLYSPTVDGQALINVAKAVNPAAANNFAGSAGVSEGYTVEQHTRMVFDQYNSQLRFSEVPNIRLPSGESADAVLRVAVALHDIGKPAAVTGGYPMDSSYARSLIETKTSDILVNTMKSLGFAGSDIDFARAIVRGDPVGSFLQGKINIDQAAGQIRQAAIDGATSVGDFTKSLEFYYTADAGSYQWIRDRGVFESSVDGKLSVASPDFQGLKSDLLESPSAIVATGRDPFGIPVSEDLFIEQASKSPLIQNGEVRNIDQAFRFDKRTPAEIADAGGWFPKNMGRTLPAEATDIFGYHNNDFRYLVSTTSASGNPAAAWPGNFPSPNGDIVYEYDLQNFSGAVKAADGLAHSESEIYGRIISLDSTKNYRVWRLGPDTYAPGEGPGEGRKLHLVEDWKPFKTAPGVSDAMAKFNSQNLNMEPVVSAGEAAVYGDDLSNWLINNNATPGYYMDQRSYAAQMQGRIQVQGVTGDGLSSAQSVVSSTLEDLGNGMNKVEVSVYRSATESAFNKGLNVVYDPTAAEGARVSFSNGKPSELRIGGTPETFRQNLTAGLYKVNQFNSVNDFGISNSPFNVLASGQTSAVHSFLLEIEAQAAGLYAPGCNQAAVLRQAIAAAELKTGMKLTDLFRSLGAQDLLPLVKDNPSAILQVVANGVAISGNKPFNSASSSYVRMAVRNLASDIKAGTGPAVEKIKAYQAWNLKVQGTTLVDPAKLGPTAARLSRGISGVGQAGGKVMGKLGTLGLVAAAGFSVFQGVAEASEVRKQGGGMVSQFNALTIGTGKAAGGIVVDNVKKYPIEAVIAFTPLHPLAWIRPTVDLGRPAADAGVDFVWQAFDHEWVHGYMMDQARRYADISKEVKGFQKEWEQISRKPSLSSADEDRLKQLTDQWSERTGWAKEILDDANQAGIEKYKKEFNEVVNQSHIPNQPITGAAAEQILNAMDNFKAAVKESAGENTATPPTPSASGFTGAVNLLGKTFGVPGLQVKIGVQVGMDHGVPFVRVAGAGEVTMQTGAQVSNEVFSDRPQTIVAVLADDKTIAQGATFGFGISGGEYETRFGTYKNITFNSPQSATANFGNGDVEMNAVEESGPDVNLNVNDIYNGQSVFDAPSWWLNDPVSDTQTWESPVDGDSFDDYSGDDDSGFWDLFDWFDGGG